MILTTLRITCEFSPIFWLRKLTHRQTGWSSPRNELEGTHGLERWVQTPNLSFCRPRAGLTQGCAAPEAACCRQGPAGGDLHGGDQHGASGSSLLPQIDLGRPYCYHQGKTRLRLKTQATEHRPGGRARGTHCLHWTSAHGLPASPFSLTGAHHTYLWPGSAAGP